MIFFVLGLFWGCSGVVFRFASNGFVGCRGCGGVSSCVGTLFWLVGLGSCMDGFCGGGSMLVWVACMVAVRRVGRRLCRRCNFFLAFV